MSVVDIVASLSTRTVVHVKYKIEVVCLAPAHHRVDALVAVFLASHAHIILIGEEFVVKGQSDGVGTLLSNEIDVGLGNVVVLELLPEFGSKVGTYGLLHHQVDHPSRVGTSETEHISLGVKPVSKIGSLYQQLLAVGFDKVVTANGHKSLRALLPATCSAGSE